MMRFVPEDIERLERALAMDLPEEYKSFTLNRAATAPFNNILGEFGDSIEWLIEENMYCRADGFFGQTWPQNFFVIDNDGSGNLYFLDVARTSSPVFFADHEFSASHKRLVIEEHAPTLATWIAQCQPAGAADYHAEEQAYRARKQHKRWWQFWR